MELKTPEQYEAVTESIRKYTLASVSQNRYEHSVRVAETCRMLCLHYGEDPLKGYLAGMGHDMCKNMSDRLLLSLSARDGNEITRMEKDKPSLLHGRAAAVKMRDDFGIEDEEIIEAVANHTFGKPGLSNLGILLYVADKIEPGREQVTPEYMERLLKMSLKDMAAFVVKESMDYVSGKKHRLSEATKLFYESLAN